MRVLAAFDSFKGSLTSTAAGAAVRAGVLAAVPGAEVEVVAVADGGEGTVAAVLAARPGDLVEGATVDALGRPLQAGYARLADGRAVLEAARTIGLDLLDSVDASVPPRATSYGLGVQLAAALAAGPGPVLLGLGGTATTDGGAGLLAALGAVVSAGSGNPLLTVSALADLPDLSRVEVLTDVTSPLLGTTGAARTFGPQKGATPDQVAMLEAAMTRWADLLSAASPGGRARRDHPALRGRAGRPGRDHPVLAEAPGAGAAGGLGAALLACGARLVPGFDAVSRLVGLPDAVARADLVLTGEGALDAQTVLGKGPAGVAALARAHGVPVVALAGRVGHPLGPTGDLFDGALSIHPRPLTATEALDPATAAAGLAATAGQVARLVAAATATPAP